MTKTSHGVAIALDNCCALEVVDDRYRIISSKKNAVARKIYWSKGIYHNEVISELKEFLPISGLLEK